MRRFVPLALALAVCLPVAATEGGDTPAQKLEKQLAKSKDANERAEAAWDLGQMGAEESVPALTKALGDSSDAVRANAAASLWHLGDASRPAIPDLKQALDDRSSAVVGNAAGALGKLGVPKAQLLPAYKRLLAKPDCESRVIAVKGLVNEVPPGDLFDSAWECGEVGDDSDQKSESREALRKIVKRRDRVLVPRILATLRNVGARDASDLTSAIGNLEPPVKEAVPVLAALITAPNEYTQRGALSALGDMKAAALPAVPDVIACLSSPRASVDTRERAAKTLGEIGPVAAATAVPALTRVAEGDKWPKVRKASLEALGEIGEPAKSAVPVLRAALKDPDASMSIAARNALFRVQPGSREEVSDISDKSRPVQKGSLYDDPATLKATLSARFPEVFEMTIYPDSANALAPYPESKTGRGKFNYAAGTVTGPEEEEGRSDCKKKIALASVNFSVLPSLVKQTPALLGLPAGKVSVVTLATGVFCHGFGWQVMLDKGGMVDFHLDGKVNKVMKF